MPENFHIGRKESSTESLQSQQISTAPRSIMDSLNEFVLEMGKVKTKDLVLFFRLLATMINAGMSLVKSLKVLANQTNNKKFQRIINKIVLNIENGQSLSGSLEEFPTVFNEAQIGMIHSGEATGKLNQILLQLADQVEKQAALKSKIRGAMMYPSVIISFVFAAGLIMMYYVVPQITVVFKDANVELPFLTRVVVAISDFLKAYTFGMPNILLLIVGIVVFIIGFLKWKSTPTGKRLLDSFILRLPLFGDLSRKAILAQFCQSLSALSSSGISIIKSLQIVSEIVDNETYRKRILMIADDVKRGISIAENLKDDTKLFPAMVSSMIAVGEQTAQLDTVTEKIAAFYQDEVDDMVKNLSALLEPFIIVFIGIGVGFLVGALMKPIMMMSEVASQM